MSNRYFLMAMAGALGSTVIPSTGCRDYVAEYDKLTDPKLAIIGSSSGTGGHGGGTGGAGGSLPPECSGDPTQKNVIDACGVFAQANAPEDGDGTQARPFATLAEAVAAAQGPGKRVYACAGAPFVEGLVVSAGLEIYGGFNCAKGWAWSPEARALLIGPAGVVALTIEKSAGAAKIEGFAITAASPDDMTGGGSSIAVAVADVAATIERCDVKASDAADGPDGQASAPPAEGVDALVDPTTMNACINPGSVAGGAPGEAMCEDGLTRGGDGGKGGITGTTSGDGQSAADGQPADAVKGKGGTGEDALNECVDGTKGKSGTAGGPGPGGSAAGDMLSLSGILNSDATDGKSGTKAQGGGGGGGAKSGKFCGGGVDGNGASGGGGGAGGCGGKGGGGGKAGGSSIAIVSLGTALTLAEVTVTVGKAGKGGGGVTGQNGGAFGLGAVGGVASPKPPSKPGCRGGDGGAGGAGGPGGGGRGGHAIGILYAKAPTTVPLIGNFTPGLPGAGGPGAAGAAGGDQGRAGQCWDFLGKTACK